MAISIPTAPQPMDVRAPIAKANAVYAALNLSTAPFVSTQTYIDDEEHDEDENEADEILLLQELLGTLRYLVSYVCNECDVLFSIAADDTWVI